MESSAIRRSGLRTRPIPRIIGKFTGNPNGPSFVAVGSIHGNEPSGRLALERIAERLRPIESQVGGQVQLLVGNVRAVTEGVRFLESDLNREWTRESIIRNSSVRFGRSCEDAEQHELLTIFRDVLRTAADEVYVLDLHSTSAGGPPFATVGDTMRNRRFARKLPVTILLGIEEQLEGTMLEFLNNEGAVTLGFEAGQNTDPESVDNHEALVLLALAAARILPAQLLPDFAELRSRLSRATGKSCIFEVRHREPVSPLDKFRMGPGFQNFDPVKRGQVLAENRRGLIEAPESGLIMMPLYQKQGEDGFFIVRRVAPFWLWLSATLRRLRLADYVHILPGVKRFSKRPEQLQINTHVARFFPLQVFHLLGFRKLRWKRNFLLVSRRRHDTQSPFAKWRA